MNLLLLYTRKRLIDRSICVENEFELPIFPIFPLWREPLNVKFRARKIETFVTIFDFCLGLASSLGTRDPDRIDRDEKQRET